MLAFYGFNILLVEIWCEHICVLADWSISDSVKVIVALNYIILIWLLWVDTSVQSSKQGM